MMKSRMFGRALLAGSVMSVCVGVAAPALAQAAPAINARGMSPNSATAPAAATAASAANQKTAFDYFVAKGLTKKQAAGIVGNLVQESGVDPKQKQIGGGPGRGIAQWSVGGRWDTYKNDNAVWYANTKLDKSRYDLGAQLAFVWYELKTFGNYGLSSLKKTDTIDKAVVSFQNDFEGCGDCQTAKREKYAHDAYDKYK